MVIMNVSGDRLANSNPHNIVRFITILRLCNYCSNFARCQSYAIASEE